jgi:hypothetical protein
MSEKNEYQISEGKWDALSKEIGATRSLMIKTDNLIQNLHHEIKESRRESHHFLSVSHFKTLIAYCLFATLSFGGVYFAFQSKTSRGQKVKDEVVALRNHLEMSERKNQELLIKSKTINEKVRRLYEMVSAGKRDQALIMYQDLKLELQNEGYFEGFIQTVIEAPGSGSPSLEKSGEQGLAAPATSVTEQKNSQNEAASPSSKPTP